jgi:hypothetical protein
MPRSSTGKWVQRAASTGGGRTYRGQRPVNWYASLVVIAVLGLISVVWARYEYQNPSSASAASKVQPAVGTSWYSAMGMNICGTQQPALPASASTSKAGMTTNGKGVLVIAPKTKAQAGDSATLSQFISTYPGLTLTSTSIGAPGQHVLHNGDKCPKGTPDAGKTGTVQVAYWKSDGDSVKDHQLVSDPATLKPANESLLTMNFLPAGASVAKPPSSAIVAMLTAFAATPSTSSSTTTTAPASSTTTTTAPSTTTTAGSTSSSTSTTSKK